MGVDIKKGAIATGKEIEQAIETNNPEHLIGAAASGAIGGFIPIAQVVGSLPSPKLTPEEVIADEEKNLEMKGPASFAKNFKGLPKPKTDK